MIKDSPMVEVQTVVYEDKNCTYCIAYVNKTGITFEELTRFAISGEGSEKVKRVAVLHKDQSFWQILPEKVSAFMIEYLLQRAEEDGTIELYGAVLKEAQLEFRRNENER